jgi:hypothetical protein
LKNIRMLVIGLIAGVLLASSATAFGAAAVKQITAVLHPELVIKVDGKTVKTKNTPISYNGNTYVPLRDAGEIFGYKVGYKNGGTITLDQITKDVEPLTTEVKITGSVRIRDLMNLIGEKYPDLESIRDVNFNNGTNVLKFNDQSFLLVRYADDTVSPEPLIEAGILSAEDFQ